MLLSCALSLWLSIAAANINTSLSIAPTTTSGDSTSLSFSSLQDNTLDTEIMFSDEIISGAENASTANVYQTLYTSQPTEEDNSAATSTIKREENFTIISTTEIEDNSSTKDNSITRSCSEETNLTCVGSFCESEALDVCHLAPFENGKYVLGGKEVEGCVGHKQKLYMSCDNGYEYGKDTSISAIELWCVNGELSTTRPAPVSSVPMTTSDPPAQTTSFGTETSYSVAETTERDYRTPFETPKSDAASQKSFNRQVVTTSSAGSTNLPTASGTEGMQTTTANSSAIEDNMFRILDDRLTTVNNSTDSPGKESSSWKRKACLIVNCRFPYDWIKYTDWDTQLFKKNEDILFPFKTLVSVRCWLNDIETNWNYFLECAADGSWFGTDVLYQENCYLPKLEPQYLAQVGAAGSLNNGGTTTSGQFYFTTIFFVFITFS